MFGARNRVSGSGGCNRLLGKYRLTGARLTIGNLGGTMMDCPSGMENEHQFVAALAKVRNWRVDGQRLDLLDAPGSVVLRFVTGEPQF